MGDTSWTEIINAAVLAIAGGAAAWKVLPILAAKLAGAIAGAKSETSIITTLSDQLEKATARAEQAENWARNVVAERNDLLNKVGELTTQVNSLQRTVQQQTATIEQMRGEMQAFKDAVNAKPN